MEVIGYCLRDFRSLQWGHAFGGALLRILGGFAAAYIAVKLVGADGINRQVLLLYGSLPAAAMNFILRKVWSGSESRGVHRCSQHFFFRWYHPVGVLADPLARSHI